MPGGGTRTFLEPKHYEAGLRAAQIEAVIASRGRFRARLTWAELHNFHVLRCEEDSPRVAYVHLAPQLVFVTFPTSAGLSPVWRGTQLQADDIVFHSRGEQLHHLTRGPFVWSVIAVDAAQLEYYGQVLARTPLVPPPEGRILRLSPREAARLRRLHAQACRLAEGKAKILSHPEVARAIEQDLLEALVSCLTNADIRADGFAIRHHAGIMIRFEAALAELLDRPPSIPQLCELLGVSHWTLRSCCTEFLGMSPTRYVLLRRLSEVRKVLCGPNPETASVAEIAQRFGFAEPGRFAGTYRAIFGETPSTTLRRHSRTRPAAD